jgi:tetratricopeptide (TPR) repeat protein
MNTLDIPQSTPALDLREQAVPTVTAHHPAGRHERPGAFFFMLMIATVAMVGGIVALLLGGVPDTPAFEHRMFAADYRNAHAVLDRGDWMGLLSSADAMKALDPDAFASYALRGEAEYRLGRYRDAIADNTCALQLMDSPSAAAELKTFRGLAPENSTATIRSVAAGLHASLGRDECEFGVYGPALQDCNAALELSPGLEDALFWRAVVYEHVGRPGLTIRDMSVLIAPDPPVAAYFELRSQAYRALGKAALAEADTKRAAALDIVNDPALIQTHDAATQLDQAALSQVPVRSKLAFD